MEIYSLLHDLSMYKFNLNFNKDKGLVTIYTIDGVAVYQKEVSSYNDYIVLGSDMKELQEKLDFEPKNLPYKYSKVLNEFIGVLHTHNMGHSFNITIQPRVIKIEYLHSDGTRYRFEFMWGDKNARTIAYMNGIIIDYEDLIINRLLLRHLVIFKDLTI